MARGYPIPCGQVNQREGPPWGGPVNQYEGPLWGGPSGGVTGLDPGGGSAYFWATASGAFFSGSRPS